jgi:hypothetical protein
MHCFVIVLIVITTVIADNQTNIFPDCKSGPLASFPICDQSVSTYQRAVDLIS